MASKVMLVLVMLPAAGALLFGSLPPAISNANRPDVLRGGRVKAQLVRIPKPDDDNNDGNSNGGSDDDGTILAVSQVEDASGQTLEATGRSVASLQFMITNRMKSDLISLGYLPSEIDEMDPPRAAKIISTGQPSSKRAQSREKRKTDRFELQFTCNVCGGPNSHSISKHAYTKGTVVVTCPGCQAAHLIADHLSWIEDDFRNLEEYMANRGTPVTRLVTNSSAASAAASMVASEAGVTHVLDQDSSAADEDGSTEANAGVIDDPRRPWRGTKPAVKPISGISEEQARRIREAVRNHKRRQGQRRGGSGPGADGFGDGDGESEEGSEQGGG